MKKNIILILLIIPILFSHYLLAQEKFYMIVENRPEFTGGKKKFSKYLHKNLKYPKKAKRQGIEGKVFVEFMVNIDGSITDVKVLKGIGSGCDEEAVKVIKNSPKWIAGTKRGKAVKMKVTIPIVFELKKKKKNK